MSHNEIALLILWNIQSDTFFKREYIPEPTYSTDKIFVQTYSKVTTKSAITDIFAYFLQENIFEHVYVVTTSYAYEADIEEILDVECVNKEDITTGRRSHLYYDYFETLTDERDKSYYVTLYADSAQKWIREYITRWLKEELESFQGNFFKPKIQVELVLELARDICNRYSGRGFTIENPKNMSLEFITVCIIFFYLGFFEKLEMLSGPLEENVFKFRVKFSENFLKKIKITTNNNGNEFFSEICEYFLGTNNKITVKEGNCFEYKKLQYQTKGKEALPNKLLQLLLSSKNFCLSWDDIVVHLGTVDREKVKKSLDSFQRNMKRQLLIPKEIRLFSVGDDSIVLNQDLWNV